jgi:hypothetical protein
MTSLRFDKTGLIIPHVLHSKIRVSCDLLKEAVLGDDVDITERANGLVPPAMRSEGDANTHSTTYNGRIAYLGI